MNKRDKDEFTSIVVNALNDVVIPAMDDMEKGLRGDLASKKDLKELSMKVDSLDRKFDAQQERLDKHNGRIESLEKIHPKGRHSPLAY
jgi:peptidoglycan hydrolase CwlO-like protein